MNIYEDDNLIIKYSDNDKEYINEIIEVLSKKSKKIMSFFKLKSLSKKINIVIWDSAEKYRNQLELQLIKLGREYKEWMKADTFDGNINMMTIDAVRTTKNRENYSLSEFLESICHEFVHMCNKELKDIKVPIWFREMLATNLGNPSYNKMVNININITLEELNNDFDNIKGNYSFAYTIGKYLFKEYGEEYIYKLMTDNKYFEENLYRLFNEAKEWSNKQGG